MFNSCRRRIISICGPSAAGKTFLSKKFTNYCSISTDDYYYGKDQMTPDENGIYDFDSPTAVNLQSCAEAVQKLATLPEGDTVLIPDYSLLLSKKVGEKPIIVPNKDAIIVVEGIFSFHEPLLELADFRIFIDPPKEVCLARRYRRDMIERNKTPEEILLQYPSVLQGYENHIKDRKQYADLVLDFGVLI